MTDQLTVAEERQENKLVFLSNRGEAVTDSITIAEMFGKEHKNVTRDIRETLSRIDEIKDLEEAQELGINFDALRFEPVEYKDSGNRTYMKYLLNFDAFMLVTMGYTTQKAMLVKIKYINEFNRMKQQLQKPISEREQLLATMKLAFMHDEELVQVKAEITTVKHEVKQIQQQVQEQIIIDHGEQRRLQRAIGTRVYAETSDSERRSQLFRELHREIRDRFGIASYRDLKRKDLQLAIRYIEGWIPRREVTA